MDGPNQGDDLLPRDSGAVTPAAGGGRGYVVVARRYRPQSFHDLVGQNSISRALSNAILANRVGHAYLFTGARGVGKTSSARILAKCLNCVQGPTPTPCNECDICRAVSVGEDVDVLEIDGASNRGIDEIRELRQNVNVRPSRARFKIYIIDEVHMLTTPAFNALLKTLEEPPEHVKFIFCTTEAEKIPITILSRCQRFDFAGIGVGEIAARLRQIAENEGVEAEPEALELLARRAAGSMRDSQSLLEQLLSFGGARITAIDVHAMLGTAGDKRLSQILELLVARQPGAALRELDEALGEGVDVGQIIGQLLGIFRDCLVAAVGSGAESFLHVGPAAQAIVQEAGSRLGAQTILAAMQILDHTLARMRYSTHGRTLAELALVRIAGLEDLEQISAVISQLNSGVDEASLVGSRRETQAPSDAAKKKPDAELSLPPSAASGPVPPLSVTAAPASSGGAAPAATVRAPGPTAPALERASAPPVASPGTLAVNTTQFESPAVVDDAPRVDPARPAPASQARSADDLEARNRELAAAMSGELDEEPSSAELPSSGSALRDGRVDVTGLDAWQVWRNALERVEDTTADFARKGEKAWFPSDAAISGPNQLVVAFPTKYTSSKSICERPERMLRLVQALAETAGGDWSLRFEVLPPEGEGASNAPPSRPAPRRDLITEKSQHPLVQKTVELFRARVARVEEAAS
ncbi:MAG: DNA polymerase III subunit gamma/tau [Planctomycetaceae bacterium]|nr:DNA polymerase III subunit gamma/tau [Planctomycetaceae bacterium]